MVLLSGIKASALGTGLGLAAHSISGREHSVAPLTDKAV